MKHKNGGGKKGTRQTRRIVVLSIAGVIILAAIGTGIYLVSERPHFADGVSAEDEEQIVGDTRSRSTKVASLQARNKEDAGDIDGAAKLLKDAIPKTDSVEEKVTLYKQLSSVYSNNGRRSDATDAINEATKLQPANWSLYKNLGLIDESYGDIEGAKAQYAKADEVLKGTPDYDTYHDSLQTLIRTAGTDE